jgi:dUTP pyrophosphatase
MSSRRAPAPRSKVIKVFCGDGEPLFTVSCDHTYTMLHWAFCGFTYPNTPAEDAGMALELPYSAWLTPAKANVRADQLWFPAGARCPLKVVSEPIVAGATRGEWHKAGELFALFEHGCATPPEVAIIGPWAVPRRCGMRNRPCTIRVFAEANCPLTVAVTEQMIAVMWAVDEIYDASRLVDLGMTIIFPHDINFPALLSGEFAESKFKAGQAANLQFKFKLDEGMVYRARAKSVFMMVLHGCAMEPRLEKFDRPTETPLALALPTPEAPALPISPVTPLTVGIRLNHPDAEVPWKGSLGAAGFDLMSVESVVIPSNGHSLVSTGFALEIPTGYFGRIVARSGLAYLHGLIVGAGIIDSDYRGDIKVLLFNTTGVPADIGVGDRIAQIMIERLVPVGFSVRGALSSTPRGEGGFGSTGI